MTTISERANVLARRVFMPSPSLGTLVHAAVFDASADGRRLLSVHAEVRGSDTVDVTHQRVSEDCGLSWSQARQLTVATPVTGGMWRSHHTGYYYDPHTGWMLSLWNEAVLPTDRSSETISRVHITYTVSTDGGRTESARQPLVQAGAEFSAEHPIPGVWIGRNSFLRGDLGCRPVTRQDGAILVPAQVTPLGPDGQRYDPHGTVKYRDSIVLIGHWQADGTMLWDSSERIVADPATTTRGVLEPTIAALPDGRILMLMRGSNAKRPDLAARRWQSISADGGHTWSTPQPWRFTDGGDFYSPSSCSQLLTLRDGRLLWFGNICHENAVGNSPRYPFVFGEVCPATGALIRQSCRIIDDRAAEESPYLNLSNFLVREEQATGDVLLYMSRVFAQDFRRDGHVDWTADSLEYRIDPHA